MSKHDRAPRLCLVSSSGGHWEQLQKLQPLIDKYEGFLVTEKTQFPENASYFMIQTDLKDKFMLEQFPAVKHAAKRAYQVVSVATNRDKVKAEGDITHVSPDDGYEYFYGYYDKSPWDATDRYMICVRVQQAYKSVAPKEPGTVCLIDTKDGNKVIEIGTTILGMCSRLAWHSGWGLISRAASFITILGMESIAALFST